MEAQAQNFLETVFRLCGKDLLELPESKVRHVLERLSNSFKGRKLSDSFSFRQLNEVLLLCDQRIVSEAFFKFLARNGNSRIKFEDFPAKVEHFRKLAMLQFGSFRFAYISLSRKASV